MKSINNIEENSQNKNGINTKKGDTDKRSQPSFFKTRMTGTVLDEAKKCSILLVGKNIHYESKCFGYESGEGKDFAVIQPIF